MADETTRAEADALAQARHWIARLASGTVSEAELVAMRAWIDAAPAHREAFARERQTWQDLAVIRDAFVPTGPASAAPPARRPARRVIGLAAVAAAVVLLGAPRAMLWFQADHVSAAGRIERVTLADGSVAMLDSDTAIDERFDAQGRTVRLLKGRGWFDVRHGDARPFRVEAGDGAVQDIGTAFEVDRTDGGVKVGVTDGVVRVAGATGAALTLRTGERAGFATGAAAARLAAAPGGIAAWRNGEILLHDVPLAAAIAQVGRYRVGSVLTFGDFASAAPVSGVFRTDRADDALETIVAMRGLQQLHLPGGILLLRRR